MKPICFCPSPAIDNVSLSHPVTLSLDAKITQSLVQFASPALAATYATAGTVFGTFDIGMTINFNGGGGLPAYVGFVQIVPWTSDSPALANYSRRSANAGERVDAVHLLIVDGQEILRCPWPQRMRVRRPMD